MAIVAEAHDSSRLANVVTRRTPTTAISSPKILLSPSAVKASEGTSPPQHLAYIVFSATVSREQG